MKSTLKAMIFLSMVATPSLLSASVSATDANDITLSAAGDATKGKRLFNRCRACHNLTATARTRIGPNLDNLFGRKAGTADGYKYSKALMEAEFDWTETALDSWLAQPRKFLPGNKMSFAGLRKEQDRKDLMAYLREATVEAAE